METTARLWGARVLVALVLCSNLFAAVNYLIAPQRFAPGFELDGEAGRVAVLGVGLLFLMWQVPYLFAISHPYNQHNALLQACIMQAIGLIGETAILLTIPAAYQVLRSSILRFIWFDAAGLLLLIIALTLTSKKRKKRRKNEL